MLRSETRAAPGSACCPRNAGRPRKRGYTLSQPIPRRERDPYPLPPHDTPQPADVSGPPSSPSPTELTGGDDDPLSCRRGGLTVRLILDTPDTRPPLAGWLPERVAAAMAEAGAVDGTLNLLLVDDAAMGAMHQTFHGDSSTTDVLTFDLRDVDDADLEGDVALCVDEAARRAAERGHPVRDEVLLYAVHGLLHLLGEDDHTPADYARMHAREDALLTAIGVGPRFAVPAEHGTGSAADRKVAPAGGDA